MIYAIDLDKFPEATYPPYYPCDWVDGDGRVIRAGAVMVDTLMGTITAYVMDQNGIPDTSKLITTYHKAPLRCIKRVIR